VTARDHKPHPAAALVPPRCELCGGVMRPEQHEPHRGTPSALVPYRCQQCGHVVMLPAEEER
jgi:hypothetical protein